MWSVRPRRCDTLESRLPDSEATGHAFAKTRRSSMTAATRKKNDDASATNAVAGFLNVGTDGSFEMSESESLLVKAVLANVDSTESVEVLWNPARYTIQRRNTLRTPRVLAGALHSGATRAVHLSSSERRFETELFVDTTDEPVGSSRDARPVVERLVAWMSPASGRARPDQVVFVWGSFRFVGAIEVIEEEWIRFDSDGTPVRAWVTLVLRG